MMHINILLLLLFFQLQFLLGDITRGGGGKPNFNHFSLMAYTKDGMWWCRVHGKGFSQVWPVHRRAFVSCFQLLLFFGAAVDGCSMLHCLAVASRQLCPAALLLLLLLLAKRHPAAAQKARRSHDNDALSTKTIIQ